MDYLTPLQAVFPGVGAAVLSVLASTAQPLTIRQLAARANASHPQVSRHVDHFERLGLLDRQIAGRSHLVRLNDSAAAGLIRRFTLLGKDVLAYMRESAERLTPPAESIVVFGSFARGVARADSDIDVAVVTPAEHVHDDAWLGQLSTWVDDVAAYSGNPVAEILVSAEELCERPRDSLWETIEREGITIAGSPLAVLFERDRVASGAST